MCIKSSAEGRLGEKEEVDVRTWIPASGKDFSRQKGPGGVEGAGSLVEVRGTPPEVARQLSLENTNHFFPLHSLLAHITDFYT